MLATALVIVFHIVVVVGIAAVSVGAFFHSFLFYSVSQKSVR